jgi:hypothetical protein
MILGRAELYEENIEISNNLHPLNRLFCEIMLIDSENQFF